MAENLSCTVVTPAQTVFTGEATYVGLPGEAGGFGVMKRHEPLVSTLKPGVVRIEPLEGGKDVRYLVSGGYAQIDDNVVIVLADDAVDLANVDVAAVEAELGKVEESLKSLGEGDSSRAYYQDRKNWLDLQLKSVNAAE
jgi:F-type H+-transporting ATPase subunit epsilon